MKIPTAMVAKCVELPDTANVLGEPSSIAVETAGPESIQQRERKLPKTFKNSLDIELVLVPAGEFVMGSDEHRGDSAPEHKVRISRAFYMAKHETTVAAFRRFWQESGYHTLAERIGQGIVRYGGADFRNQTWREGAAWWDPGWRVEDDHPVTLVSWYDAAALCEWLSVREDRTYRLPTEAEWEYACRAGTRTDFPWGSAWREGTANIQNGGQEEIDVSGAPSLDPRYRVKQSTTRKRRASKRGEDIYALVSPVGSFPANAWGLYDMCGNVWEH